MTGIRTSRTDYTVGIQSHIFKPVVIGDDVTVFSHALISPGVTIGDRAVIAGGAIVTRNVPSDCFVGGAPARIIKQLPPRKKKSP